MSKVRAQTWSALDAFLALGTAAGTAGFFLPCRPGWACVPSAIRLLGMACVAVLTWRLGAAAFAGRPALGRVTRILVALGVAGFAMSLGRCLFGGSCGVAGRAAIDGAREGSGGAC
ncbi:hypothetical protein [Anaeromyxobacter oryzisoli]|uniref:hypothetical protein n=1 Tax=Anaeromyxobacter oryzisoli TaxID=2925408 RepID=UPI001F58A907|nr:hypothetical protein [Anaeromyxobacter sp. SG63]